MPHRQGAQHDDGRRRSLRRLHGQDPQHRRRATRRAAPPVQGGGDHPAGRLRRVPGRRRREADRAAEAGVATSAHRPRARLHARLHRRALLRSLDRDPRSAGSEMLHARMSGHSYE